MRQPPLYFSALVDKLRADPQLYVGNIYSSNQSVDVIVKDATHPHDRSYFLVATRHGILTITTESGSRYSLDISDPTFLEKFQDIIDHTIHDPTTTPTTMPTSDHR